jgi:hypothetical protein
MTSFRWFLWSHVRNDELYLLKCYSYYFVNITFTFLIFLILHNNIEIIEQVMINRVKNILKEKSHRYECMTARIS